MDNFQIFTLFSHFIFTMTIGWYLILNLQWYGYKLQRVVFHHKKYYWHILYFLIPLLTYYLAGNYFWIYFYGGLVPALIFWYKRIDKKLVFTPRVKRYFLFLAFALLIEDALCLTSFKCRVHGIIMPLLFALAASYLFERMLFLGYKKDAEKKLSTMEDLKIVAITASYGKTSIKNFLYQILSQKYETYMTPRSVNTLGGLIKDINEDLPLNCKIYLAEAGARNKGDIDEIARLLEHKYAIVGKIGSQHIEYFKTLENIRNTKMEIINSKNLKKAFIHTSANVKPDKKITLFGQNISDINATLDGLSFNLRINDQTVRFDSPVLGSFQAINITAAVLAAMELEMDLEDIKKAVLKLKTPPHRLQKIRSGGKLIIDDSFNGNFEGMCASYDLVSSFEGKKILVTPGVVESDKQTNLKLAKKIDEVFDTVIITGSVNAEVLATNIKKPKKIILRKKDELEEILASETLPGDLILFSNDAPTFM